MEAIDNADELRSRIAAWRETGNTVGFVPTMGNLHAGHLSLVHLARRNADRVVVSLFVNPMQFGPGEDFDQYPRTLEEDRRKLLEAQADLLFVPAIHVMYPANSATMTFVEVPGLSTDLCGRFRPGHFRGVATIVCKLLNLVRPDCMVLGEKDYQQLTLIRRMVRDLDLPVRILGGPTVREPSGLALSSRNAYLSAAQQAQAATLYRQLEIARSDVEEGRKSRAEAERDTEQRLVEAGFRVDYISIRRRSDLAEACADDRALILLAAAWLGSTRLIDNIKLDSPADGCK